MTTRWEPYREPLRTTLLRTGGIAIALAVALSLSGGGIARLPANIVLALWPALGGHWIEVGFLNWLRPRLPATRIAQTVARLATWFVGGIILAQGMKLTATALGSSPLRGLDWWIAGLAFVAIELIAHVFLQLRGRPSFYNGRG